jgi:hypothetical protein
MKRGFVLGAWMLCLLALLAACAPRPAVEVRPLPGVKVTVPVEAPRARTQGATAVESGKKGGARAPVVKVLPGNPLPPAGNAFVDDFSKYPVGAVLPVVAPERYGMIRGANWQKISVEEAFDPSGKLNKAVRIEGGYGEGFLTVGAPDWTDYRVSFRAKTLEACCTDSHIRARLFLDGSGSRALEFVIGWDPIDGVGLYKLAGDQRFLLLRRRELKPTADAVLRDKNWHDFAFELRSNGTVRVWVDGTEVLSWQDPDYRQGGFGIGPKATTFLLDDLRIERLGSAAPPPGGNRPARENFCGYRAGAELPHRRFVAPGKVELVLLGGYSAARDPQVGYYPAEKPEEATFLIGHEGAFEPPTCLVPPPKAVFAFEALDASGKRAGVLLLLEDWTDQSYDDLGLLLRGAEPAE